MSRMSWTDLALECARFVRQGLRLSEEESPVAVALGSGLGAFPDQLQVGRGLPFSELPGFPKATEQGDKGRLASGQLAQTPHLALEGRLHGYEGHRDATVAFPPR